jgi:hypothetical protein
VINEIILQNDTVKVTPHGTGNFHHIRCLTHYRALILLPALPAGLRILKAGDNSYITTVWQLHDL